MKLPIRIHFLFPFSYFTDNNNKLIRKFFVEKYSFFYFNSLKNFELKSELFIFSILTKK